MAAKKLALVALENPAEAPAKKTAEETTEGFKLSSAKCKAIAVAINDAMNEATKANSADLKTAKEALAKLGLDSSAVMEVEAKLEAANLRAVAEAIIGIVKETKLPLMLSTEAKSGRKPRKATAAVVATDADISAVKAALGSKFEPIKIIAERIGIKSTVAREAANALVEKNEADYKAAEAGPWGNFKAK